MTQSSPLPSTQTAELLSVLAECFANRAQTAERMRTRATHNTTKAALHGEASAYGEVASMLSSLASALEKPLDISAESRTVSLIESLRTNH